ncbi:PD-(D/E)XK motif protein [Mumia sp. zg.B21]|uniref:PD-(D/E)XK motif protein n=1 Tax=Mumia sp. zg.B21 TaxID=2855447 RepID=UPI001C6EABA6|nr:PD-(D/E)XK motif protein [Mumia sp. zg.B21]MBW9208637.1 PD-(D/E)XK motif protein [Mumia sp. zg.B21]
MTTDRNRVDLPSSYEWLRHRILELERSPSDEVRELLWADRSRTLAVSRNPAGAIELFVGGQPVRPSLRNVMDRLEHDRWATDEGEEIDASRLVLPVASHFDSVAAFLCAELIENGVADDPADAFRRTEPLISLALERAELGNQVLLGLLGELVFLDALSRMAEPVARPDVVKAWVGSSPTDRDFQLAEIGVEVKSTSGPQSRHRIQGLRQVSRGYGVSGQPETSLFLLSLGIQWLRPDEAGGRNLPGVVDDLIERVPSCADDLLARIKQYGGDAAVGYDHWRDRLRGRYAQRFSLRFERLYDLSDPRVRLPRPADFEDMEYLEPDSVEFEVSFPERIRGDRNPVAGLTAIAVKVLEEAGIPPL